MQSSNRDADYHVDPDTISNTDCDSDSDNDADAFPNADTSPDCYEHSETSASPDLVVFGRSASKSAMVDT